MLSSELYQRRCLKNGRAKMTPLLNIPVGFAKRDPNLNTRDDSVSPFHGGTNKFRPYLREQWADVIINVADDELVLITAQKLRDPLHYTATLQKAITDHHAELIHVKGGFTSTSDEVQLLYRYKKGTTKHQRSLCVDDLSVNFLRVSYSVYVVTDT